MNEVVGQKLASASELETEIESLRKEIARLKPEAPVLAPMRSMEELQTIVDEQIISLEKKRAAIEERQANILRLSSNLSNQQSELTCLHQQDREHTSKVAAKEAKERDEQKVAYNKQISALTEWYKSIISLHRSMSGVQKVELVRQDNLLITLESPSDGALLPLHLRVCPATGKLLAAQIGNTSSTPRRGQWKEIIHDAVSTNNIPYLVRQVYAALSKS